MHSLLVFCVFALLLASTFGTSNSQDALGYIDIDAPTAAKLQEQQEQQPPDHRQEDVGGTPRGPRDWGLVDSISSERGRLPMADLVRLLLTAYSKHPREGGHVGPPLWQQRGGLNAHKSKRYMGVAVADFVQPKNGGLEDEEGLGERGGEGRAGQPRRKVRLLGSG